MIAAALAMVLAQPAILEYPTADSKKATLQAIVSIPELSSREWSAAQVLARVLPIESKIHGKYDLLRIATAAGDPVRCTVSADHFRLQLTVPSSQLELGAKVIEDLLLYPRLDPQLMKDAADNLPFERRDYWVEAMLPAKLEPVRPEDAVELHQRFFRPQNITIAVAGGFEPGAAFRYFEHFGSFWQEPRLLPRIQGKPAEAVAKRIKDVSTISLLSDPILAQTFSYQTLLMAHALGTGKWSTLHRIWREKEGISYWQECAVIPDPKGFRVALVAALAPREDEAELANKMKQLVLDDIKAWSDEILMRANGSFRATATFEQLPNPLYFQAGHPLTSRMEDTTFLRAYLKVKTGRDWPDPKALASGQIPTLAELREAATKVVETMKPQIIHGGS